MIVHSNILWSVIVYYSISSYVRAFQLPNTVLELKASELEGTEGTLSKLLQLSGLPQLGEQGFRAFRVYGFLSFF